MTMLGKDVDPTAYTLGGDLSESDPRIRNTLYISSRLTKVKTAASSDVPNTDWCVTASDE